jgi:hypothetical protein
MGHPVLVADEERRSYRQELDTVSRAAPNKRAKTMAIGESALSQLES